MQKYKEKVNNMSEREIDPNVQDAYFTLDKLIQDLKGTVKPNDRSEMDRRFAIIITELEKVLAYYQHYIINGF